MTTEPTQTLPEHERLAQWLDKHPHFTSTDGLRWYVHAATHKDYTDTAALLRSQAARIAELEAERDALRADVRVWMKIADDEVNKDQAAPICPHCKGPAPGWTADQLRSGKLWNGDCLVYHCRAAAVMD